MRLVHYVSKNLILYHWGCVFVCIVRRVVVQAVQRSLLFPNFWVSYYFFFKFLNFSFTTRSFKIPCITLTIIKINILHNISPNLGHNIISFYKMYTL